MFDLSGRNVVVTGASGGIGGAIATALHDAGAVVALSGTRQDALDRLASSLGDRCHVTPCDLGDPVGPEKLVADAAGAMGSVDVLVNNAGLTRDALVMRMKDEDWQTVIDVNLTATFKLSRACLKGMMKRRWGRIVNISSIVGTTGNAGQANYAAAKAGMVGMSRALAREVASRGITVNCIAPGLIETAMTDSLSDDQKKRLLSEVPAGCFGTVADISAGVLYLASEQAGYVTGQTLHINGGMAMI